jgi:hypothetical protein
MNANLVFFNVTFTKSEPAVRLLIDSLHTFGGELGYE